MGRTLINKTAEHVKKLMKNEETGHDWWHIYRVWKTAKRIAEKEGGNTFIIEMAALLHDLDDYKVSEGSNRAREWMERQGLEKRAIQHILEIIEGVSFKGAEVETNPKTTEEAIVQDADRLDALGAIGIARCFATGAKRGSPIYDPEIKPQLHSSFEEYKKARGTSINHFYEKLLLLKDRMNTEEARRMAEKRHRFMELFLEEFFGEWEGES